MSPPVRDLAVHVPLISVEDSLARAAEALRTSPPRAVPVAAEGRLLGLLLPADLAEVLDGAAEIIGQMPVAALQPRPCLPLPASAPAREALAMLREHGVEAAPVVDEAGRYLGMVGTGELLSALCGRIRPPLIGGMATPFGVYLTTGVVRGGVGDLALLTTGIYMAALFILAQVLISVLLQPDGLLARWPWFYSLTVGEWLTSTAGFTVATWVCFALLFRSFWVAGYHAAEHQVVHALEAGEELVPDVVRRKPRVHPRCGTNLVVGLLLLLTLLELYSQQRMHSLAVLLAVIGIGLGFRPLGALVQHFVTTRPASREQIENGIRAGKELLARHQQALSARASLWRRIWNMGILQVMGGFGLVILTLLLLSRWIPGAANWAIQLI